LTSPLANGYDKIIPAATGTALGEAALLLLLPVLGRQFV
jgi:hypothetical protein